MPDPIIHPTRHRLPDVRPSITQREVICGYKCYITVSFFDGHESDRSKPAEVFVVIAKHGSIIAGLIDGLMVTLSTSLQYGVPWNVLRDKLLHHTFERNGDLVNTSLLDGIAKTVDKVIEERKRIIGHDEPPPAASSVPKPNPDPITPLSTVARTAIEQLADKFVQSQAQPSEKSA